jgi:hypothetical protein
MWKFWIYSEKFWMFHGKRKPTRSGVRGSLNFSEYPLLSAVRSFIQCQNLDKRKYVGQAALLSVYAFRHLPFIAFSGFSGAFTLSTSLITSLNGSGICGMGLELVILS